MTGSFCRMRQSEACVSAIYRFRQDKEFMMDRTIRPCRRLQGEIEVPGDKSISHRAVMLGALSEGTTEASHFLMSADCLSTISCFERMGIHTEIDRRSDAVTVSGKGLHGLKAPKELLYTGNSGTTTRILAGILAGQTFDSILDGDESIRTRPMARVIKPLSMMGASVRSELGNGCTPLHISGRGGRGLHGIDYRSPVASAQVKSCVLLAGLYAEGNTSVTEPALSRNHTELMLKGFGADVKSEQAITSSGSCWRAGVRPEPHLYGQRIAVPGDISSAAYFIAAGLLVPDSEIVIRNVGTNPTRAGILKAARMMGADLFFMNRSVQGGEESADILVKNQPLHGCEIGGDLVPALIDELPVIAVMAAFADGETVIRDAAELKVKESDRIAVMTECLSAMGADITPTEDGMIIRGGKTLHGAAVDSHKDHRIAMTMAVAALASEGPVTIKDADCVKISYPEFYDDLNKLR